MVTLLSRSPWAKMSLFRKNWPFLLQKVLILNFWARSGNQRLRIDPFANFQLHWTEDKGTRILTWNHTENRFITSYSPPADDLSKIFMGFERFYPRILPC